MLHTLKPARGSRQLRKRVGRGNSAGGGTTAGRGTKGQKSRSGFNKNLIFEGGQTPLLRRQPKLGGFKNPKRKEYEALNIGVLDKILDSGKYSLTDLREKKVIKTKKPFKILSSGELNKKLEIEAHAASKKAVEAVEKAGGKINLVV